MEQVKAHKQELEEVLADLDISLAMLASLLGVTSASLTEGREKAVKRLNKVRYATRTFKAFGVDRKHLLGLLDAPIHEMYFEDDDSQPHLLSFVTEDEKPADYFEFETMIKAVIQIYRLENKIRELETSKIVNVEAKKPIGEMIDDLIDGDVEEIVNSVRAGNDHTPGDLRHILHYGRGYDTWKPEDIEREWRRRQ